MGLIKRINTNNLVTSDSINQALSGASTQQIDETKNYLNISGFVFSDYDLDIVKKNPLIEKILDAGSDDV